MKPASCSRCGRTTRYLAAHHHDYSKPLEIKWMCYSCHNLEHFPNNKRRKR